MTATITNIAEFRNGRATDEAARIVYFSDWSDERLIKRRTLLNFIAQGYTEGTDPANPLYTMSFPNGYDPAEHLSENIEAVQAEGVRRGVFVASE